MFGVPYNCIIPPVKDEPREESESPLRHLQDRVLELEQHQGRDRADLVEKIRVLESQAHAAYCCNDDAAKGVGVLTSRVDKMEKDAEILKDKTGRELSQAFAEVNRVLSEHKKRDDAAQERIKGLEYRLGLAQDRIAEIHPSGCVPPAKSKPKSRLKTDRVKKVKP